MKALTVVVLVFLAAGAVALGVYLRQEEAAPEESFIGPQEADRTLREMRIDEATATTTAAIERRLRLATAIAEEGEIINLTGCIAHPLVLKVKSNGEVIFDNREPQRLILLMNEKDYYTIQPNGTLTIRADFEIENNNNIIRYVCGKGGGAPTFHGFILVE